MNSPRIILPPGSSLSRDIPQFPRTRWCVDVDWLDIERHIQRALELGCDLNPEYQREHVWTNDQRAQYVEYALQGGEVSKTLIFATTDWYAHPPPMYSLLDGKQRLEAVRMFMRDELRVFGLLRSEFKDKPRWPNAGFKWQVVETKSYAEMLRLYLSFNGGGVKHTAEELARVEALRVREEERLAQVVEGLYTCDIPVPASIAAMHTGARIVAATPPAGTGEASAAPWHGPGATKPGMGHMMVLACGCVVTSDVADKPCAKCNPSAPPLKLRRLTFGQQVALRGLALRPGGMVILRGGGAECADPGVAAKLVKLELAYKDAELLNGVVIRERVVITEKGKALLNKGSA